MKNLGHQGRIAGREAEQRVEQELTRAGWPVETSAELDYANKTDLRTECPTGQQWNVQVSTSPKSKGQRTKLEGMGITPVAESDLNRSGLEAADFICQQVCTVQQCPENPSEIPVMINNAQSHS